MKKRPRALEMLGGIVVAIGFVEELAEKLESSRVELVERAHNEGASQAEISAVLGVSQPSVSKMLAKVEHGKPR